VRLVARNFNAFVISAYVLAGFFTYVLAWRMTADSLASVVAGLVYACGGFMVAHLGHTTMIHAAAWAPLVVTAIDRLPESRRLTWWAIGAAAIGCCILAGHPQIPIYTLVLGRILAIFNVISAVGFAAKTEP
jgi:hypothetical protein